MLFHCYLLFKVNKWCIFNCFAIFNAFGFSMFSHSSLENATGRPTAGWSFSPFISACISFLFLFVGHLSCEACKGHHRAMVAALSYTFCTEHMRLNCSFPVLMPTLLFVEPESQTNNYRPVIKYTVLVLTPPPSKSTVWKPFCQGFFPQTLLIR